MFTFLSIAALLAVAAVEARPKVGLLRTDGRIVGGEVGSIRDHPYQVSLQVYKIHDCGGSIIQKRYILTASHCVDGQRTKDLRIRHGSSYHAKEGEIVNVDEITMHSSYNPENYDYDIAVLQLSSDIDFTSYSKSIQIPTSQSNEANRMAVVCGWGSLSFNGPSPSQLYCVGVKEIDRTTCNGPDHHYGKITTRMMCFAGEKKDSCGGDSGGPLVDNGGIQIGVVSWGRGCGLKRFPGVYADVYDLRNFVNSAVPEL